jgi:hypothetical protein
MASSRYMVANVHELERLPAFGEEEVWRPVRRHFGIEAFGINAYTADQVGERIIEEHTEGGAGRHQELYLVLTGSARFTVDGDEFDAPAGTFVFIGEPEVGRGAVAAAPATTVLAIGGKPGEAYEVSAWEYAFLGLAKRGSEGLASFEEGIARFPELASLRYNLACFQALEGNRELAIDALSEAIRLEPKARQWAAGDEDFTSLEDDPEFERLIAGT